MRFRVHCRDTSRERNIWYSTHPAPTLKNGPDHPLNAVGVDRTCHSANMLYVDLSNLVTSVQFDLTGFRVYGRQGPHGLVVCGVAHVLWWEVVCV